MTTETKSIELNSETAQRIVGSKILIEAPGAYHVQVQNVHHYQGDDRDVHIVSLKAMTEYHQQKAQEFAELGMFQEACNQGLSSSQRPQDYIPSKGEIVKVNVDWVENKEQIMCLFVTSLTEIPVSVAKRKGSLFKESKTDPAFSEQPSQKQPVAFGV